MNVSVNKKKVLLWSIHLIFWFGLLLLLNSSDVNIKWGPFERSQGSLLFPLVYGLGLGAFIFYWNVYRLIPQYFGVGRKSKFWIKSILSLFLISFFELIIDIVYVVYQNLEIAKEQFAEYPLSVFIQWAMTMFIMALIPNLILWVMAFAYRLPQDWLKTQAQNNQLKQDKMQSELDFLRAQINPHFIFNGINSIYHMIGSDDDKAKQTLLQFSDLLRYQLYECNENFISLEKEISYIKNYLGVEKVRKGEDVLLSFKISDVAQIQQNNQYKIAPLLLSPFLENAFKYVSNYSQAKDNYINVNLHLTENGFLQLLVENSFNSAEQNLNKKEGGIGLTNVKRRLSILYPNDRHELIIDQTNHQYSVKLNINLNED